MSGNDTPATITGYINIYRSGLYHTPGKPGAYDRHPGDIYATEAAALDDIYPRSHYVATVPVTWVEPTVPYLNPVPPVVCHVKRYAENDNVVCTMRDPLPITPREPSDEPYPIEPRGEYIGLHLGEHE